jgi:hemerythrin-like domain-containing protein
MNLIQSLTSEHKEIEHLINGFKIGKGFQDAAWRDNLFAAKKLFLSHLEKEDTLLYPALRDAAKGDPELSALVSAYMKEMESI